MRSFPKHPHMEGGLEKGRAPMFMDRCLGLSAVRLRSGWEFHKGSLGSLWEIWRGDRATDNVAWERVSVPHCFNERDSVDPDSHYYQGEGWYRTLLDAATPLRHGGRTLLHFNGAGQRSWVCVGLEVLASHNGGYDEWTVDITEAVARELLNPENKGKVPLAILCDNSRDAETIPSDLSDFNRYGGLYRDVRLVRVPAVSLESLHVETTLGENGKAYVSVHGRLYNPENLQDDVTLSLEMIDPAGQVMHSRVVHGVWHDEKELCSFEWDEPSLWSPESPSLYQCHAVLSSPAGEHRVSDRFGLRSVEWIKHGPFKLNGERLLLRGTHYHEDHAGVAAALSDEIVRETLVKMKEMGANFVRLGHYQQAPLVLDLCDELGLLVWEEIPWCRGGLGGEGFRQQCRDMLSSMIGQHYNHPSVIIWGLGNENDWPGDFPKFDQEEIRAFMSELNGLAHHLDPSRKTAIRRCDFCKDIVDVYSPSIWAGWYGGRYTEYRSATEAAIRDIPHFFHMEYGGDSHARRYSENPESFLSEVQTGMGTAEVGDAYKASGGLGRASRDGDWSESYMVNLFDWHLMEQEQMPELTGTAQWVFKDFSTPLRPENPVPKVNQKGLLERDGTPKESYYVFQSYWSDKPMIHIHGHTCPVRWGKAGESKLVKVFSNCKRVELFVNGVSAGLRRRDPREFPAAGFHWNVPFHQGVNTLKAVGELDGTEVSDEIRHDYQTGEWGAPSLLELREISRTGDLITIEGRLFDGKGLLCLDARNLMRFSLIGEGLLLDNLGTSTGSRVVQMSNARAQISVRLTGASAIAAISTEGMETAFLKL